MKISVLLVTDTSGFGELIQQTLEDTQRYQVRLASYAGLGSALPACDLLIIDADFPAIDDQADQANRARAAALPAACPGALTILVPPLNDFNHALVEQIKPDALLTKPFYLPELVELVDDLCAKRSTSVVELPKPPSGLRIVRNNDITPDWLKDITRAAQYLARLSLESSALAALIIRENQLWASAGEMTQEETQELTRVVSSYWANQTRPITTHSPARSDLARYTRLPHSGKDVIVYATTLAESLFLALAFDATTPFSMIRTQASRLARNLATNPDSTVETQSTSPAAALAELPAQNTLRPDFQSLLDNIPPATPGQSGPEQNPSVRPFLDDAEADLFSDEPAPSPTADSIDIPHIPPAGQPASNSQSFSEPALLASPVSANLVYACVLLPRLPGQSLTGDLAVRLNEWLPQLCLAYGWRLEQLSVDTGYLLWLARLLPNTAPGYMIRVVRQQTSGFIFAAFPDLARPNPSGDFWAPGYLIMSAGAAPSPEIIHRYIQHIRLSQVNPNLAPPRVQR